MRLITDQTEKAALQKLLAGLMDGIKLTDFRREWVTEHGWKVVPVEDTAHFAPEEIQRLVPTLRNAGYSECVAVATEPVAPGPEVYRVPVSEEGFRSFNAECGMLRYLLTVEDRSWSISCAEWFNLFAGSPALLEEMLGESIEAARADYLVVGIEVEKASAGGAAAGGADGLGVHADDLAELADDHHLGGVVEQVDAGDLADFAGGLPIDDALPPRDCDPTLESVAHDVWSQTDPN